MLFEVALFKLIRPEIWIRTGANALRLVAFFAVIVHNQGWHHSVDNYIGFDVFNSSRRIVEYFEYSIGAEGEAGQSDADGVFDGITECRTDGDDGRFPHRFST